MLKTTDGRFIEARIIIPLNIISKVLFEIKARNHWTWYKFAKVLSISEYTLRHSIASKGNTLPLSVFKAILNLANDYESVLLRKSRKELCQFWGQRNNKKLGTSQNLAGIKINTPLKT